MNTETRITITTGTFLRAILVGALAYAAWVLRDLLLLVLTAVVIASAIEPGVVFFVKRRIPRAIAVLGMYAVVFGSLFAVTYFFLPPVLDDAQTFLQSAPEYLDTLHVPASLTNITDAAHVATANQSESIFETILSFQAAFADTSGGTVRVLSTFFGGIFALILVIVLSFYFALQETGVDDFLRLITPAKHEEYVVNLWMRAKKKIGQWMQGQLLLSLLVGIIVYLGLLILGVPYALFLAVAAALLDLIPLFGSFLAGILAVVVAFSSGGFTLALIVAGLYFIVNQFEAHLIYPLVVNKVVGIPPLLVILSLIIGGSLAGFLGILLSIPIAAGLREFLNDFDKSKQRAREMLH
jgi:predicted PurR-regulated permease PerM